jgi:hypothetical protein
LLVDFAGEFEWELVSVVGEEQNAGVAAGEAAAAGDHDPADSDLAAAGATEPKTAQSDGAHPAAAAAAHAEGGGAAAAPAAPAAGAARGHGRPLLRPHGGGRRLEPGPRRLGLGVVGQRRNALRHPRPGHRVCPRKPNVRYVNSERQQSKPLLENIIFSGFW